MYFESVPTPKIPEIKLKVDAVFAKIVREGDIDMKRMRTIIARQKLELTSSFESNPHSSMAHVLIGHVLYGNTKEDVSF